MYLPNAGQSTILNWLSVQDAFIQMVAFRAFLWASVLMKAFHLEVIEKSRCRVIKEEGGAISRGTTKDGCSYA